MSAVLAIAGVVLAAAGLILLAVAFSMLGNASRFGVPAPIRWRRLRLIGALLLVVGIVLVVATRFV